MVFVFLTQESVQINDYLRRIKIIIGVRAWGRKPL